MYGCESRLTEAEVPQVLVPKVDTKSAADGGNEARTILYHLLSLKRRKLTDPQLKYCLEQVAHEPTALCLRYFPTLTPHVPSLP